MGAEEKEARYRRALERIAGGEAYPAGIARAALGWQRSHLGKPPPEHEYDETGKCKWCPAQRTIPE